MKNGENNGIFGYENSRHKKVKDALLQSMNGESGYGGLMNDESMSEMADYLKKEQQRWSQPVDAEEHKNRYMASARDFLVPEDNELRRRRQFVLSDRAVRDATDGIYENNVKGIFESEKRAADARAMDAYKKNISVVGADPVAATGAIRNETDPYRVMHNTMQQLPEQEIDDIAGSYARYAGLSPEKYRKNVLEPAIQQRMEEDYVAENTPKSSGEYIARSAFDNSLTGKLVNLGLDAYSPHTAHNSLNRASLSAYKANRAENLVAGIGSLAVDIPMFAGLGGVSSKAVSGISKGLSANLAKKYAARGMTQFEAERIVRRAIVDKLGTKIAMNSATQGLTLGAYDAGKSMADDLLVNDGIDVGKAVDAYGHGFATGVAVGAVGTPLRELSRGLTGGKKIAASAGVLGAESAVFTMSSTADKLMSGVDVEPIDLLYDYGESLATLGAMKLAHWRPSGGSVKLDANGRLKQKLRFSPAEAQELARAGVDPQRFMSSLEKTFKTTTGWNTKEIRDIKNDYLSLMGNDALSAATRSKLLFLVENKVTSTPPVAVDCSVQEAGKNGYIVTLLDANGRRISSRDFSNGRDLETFLIMNRGELRKNKIASYEDILLGKSDSENFFRQAGRYAEERGTDINEIAEAMYKKANGEPLDSRESGMLDDISRRSSYGDKGVGTMLYNVRRQLESEYGLHEGSLLAAVERKAYRCSAAENKALDRYLEIMQQEAELLKNGTTPERYNALEREKTPYGDWGNEEIKAREKERYINFVNSRDATWLNSNSFPKFSETDADGIGGPIKVPQNWNKPYAWSYFGLRNSYDEMARLQKHAEQMGRKLGYDLNFLFDEREIDRNSSNMDYNKRILSQGWVDNSTGKVYINLPNIKNIEDLERVVVHEVVGHRGLGNLFGNYIFDFYEELYKKADAEVLKGIHDTGQRHGVNGFVAVEEYLARLAEKGNPTPKERTLLDRLKNHVNKMLVRLNLISGDKAKVTNEDLRGMLSAHHNAMLNKENPNDYRAMVFGRFPSARRSGSYYDKPSFLNDINERIAKNEIYPNTPDYLLPDKRTLYDEFKSGNMDRKGYSYRFIGERGAQNIDRANKDKINEYSYLELAKEMEQKGATPQEIWEMTSWGRGADGKWRGEIDYETVQLNDFVYNQLYMKYPDLVRMYKNAVLTPLSKRTETDIKVIDFVKNLDDSFYKNLKVRDVVSDPKFYAAYPELAHLPVKVTSNMIEQAYYDPSEQVLYLNKDFIAEPVSLSKVIMKPLQQMIQHYEDFERGVSLSRADVNDMYTSKYLDAIFEIDEIKALEPYPELRKLHWYMTEEFEEKYGMDPEEFKKNFPTADEFIFNKLIGSSKAFMGNVELQNVMQRQEMSPMSRNEIPFFETENKPRDEQMNSYLIPLFKDICKGPMDLIMRNVKENEYIQPMRFKETSKKMNDLHFTPLERRILKTQLDDMSSYFVEMYNHLKNNAKLSETDALYMNVELFDKLKTDYIKRVATGGIHIPESELNFFNKKANTLSHGRKLRNKLTHEQAEELLRKAFAEDAEGFKEKQGIEETGSQEIEDAEIKRVLDEMKARDELFNNEDNNKKGRRLYDQDGNYIGTIGDDDDVLN